MIPMVNSAVRLGCKFQQTVHKRRVKMWLSCTALECSPANLEIIPEMCLTTRVSISHFLILDLHCGGVPIIESLNCVTSALSFGPGLFRKGFACSTRISSASVPSTFRVSSMKSFSGMTRGSSLLLRRSVWAHGGGTSRTLTEVPLSCELCERPTECR